MQNRAHFLRNAAYYTKLHIEKLDRLELTMKKRFVVFLSTLFVLTLSSCTVHRSENVGNAKMYVFTNSADIDRVIECNTDWNNCIVSQLEDSLTVDSPTFKKLLENKTCDYEYLRCLQTERIQVQLVDEFDDEELQQKFEALEKAEQFDSPCKKTKSNKCSNR